MPITSTDFSIDVSGNLRSVAGAAVYSVLDVHQWLQDLADNPGPLADDNVSILGANPSELAGKRNAARPAALTLLGSLNIDDATSQRFNFGSIEQAAGAVLYTGINTIGSGLAGRSHYVVQNGAKYNAGTKWWPAGPVRALFKVKAAGALIAAGQVTVFSREWGYSFSHFDVDCSAGSEQVAALAVSADSNATRLASNFSAGTNTVTSTSPAFVVTVTPGLVSRDLGTGALNYKGIISWTNGARLSDVWQALQWGCSELATGTLNGSPGWAYRRLDAAYPEVQAAPFGLLAGGKWFVARGWWIDTASLSPLDLQGYTLVSDNGTAVVPPVAIAVSVGGVAVGDYVLVGKDDGSGGFLTATGLTATGSAAATTLALSGAPAADVPRGAGYMRVGVNSHSYSGISGTTVSGLVPAVPAGGYAAAAVWFPLVDVLADATSEASGTFNYAADFTARVRVRNGGASPIVPFETTFAVSAAGGSVNAIRAADA